MTPELPSGRQHTLVLGEQHAVVVEVGAALRSYRVAEREVLAGYGEHEMATSARGQVLIPWPNRLEDGSYTWADTQHQLPLSEPEKHNAIHGLVRWANWTAVRQTTAEVEMRHVLHPQPGYPFTVELSVAYRLQASGLTVSTTATNVGEEPLPYAAGQHPYLAAPGVVDDCRLHLDAGTYVQTDDRGLPTGRAPVDGTQYDFRTARHIGEVELDVAFTDLARDDAGRAWVTITTGSGDVARVWVDRSYRYVELFTGDSVPDESRRRRSLGVEPMTAPPNAFADGVDITALEPGQSTTSAWGLQYSPAQQSTDTDTSGGST
jgi:aldose 1-epimerase